MNGLNRHNNNLISVYQHDCNRHEYLDCAGLISLYCDKQGMEGTMPVTSLLNSQSDNLCQIVWQYRERQNEPSCLNNPSNPLRL